MTINKTKITTRFEPEMLAKITYISIKNHRSLNAQVEFLAQKFIDEYEAENGEIKINDD